ncbi:adenylyltransferase and sulfurtransferase MOCS3, partial [Clarias magur]
MNEMDSDVLSLKKQLLEKDAEIAALKNKLEQIQKDNSLLMELKEHVSPLDDLQYTSLTNDDIMRYSRQLLLPELGVKGQMNILNTSVLVVGCGGLGCPLALYLAAAGIGRLGLLDYDEVELSNLHRQILHTERTLGLPKAQSAAHNLSSSLLRMLYNSSNSILLHCADNVPTRYLVNDACVLSGKPLVSASALRMEGQLTVYNYDGAPCYRCLYPVPPPPETVTNCSDGGVLGVVVGVMGCLQALEVLKIASGQKSSFGQQLLMFDAQDGRFRCIKLRAKKAGCAVCGETPTVTELQDYESFCGSSATDKCQRLNLLSAEQRVSVQEYKSILDCGTPHLLLDVRPKVEVDICHLPVSINIPLSSLEDQRTHHIHFLKEKISDLKMQMSTEIP